MDIVEFFNSSDADHCRAYLVFAESGQWPDGFLSAEVDVSDCDVRLAKAIALQRARRVVENDNYMRDAEAKRGELRAERRARVSSKPKLGEVPGMMREGWRLFSFYGVCATRYTAWMSKDSERKDIHANTLKALLARKVVKVLKSGGMAGNTEYVLTE